MQKSIISLIALFCVACSCLSDSVGKENEIIIISSPEDKPFISVGQTVKEGDQLFIIEAMKTMNPVKSPFSGVVKQIIIKNEMPIEYDEVLAVIDIT